MTVETPIIPADEPLALVNRKKAIRAEEFYMASGVKEMIDELVAENGECLLPITKNIHPSSVGRIIQSLPDLDSTYFDVYARATGKPKAADYYEDTQCGLVTVQVNAEEDIIVHGESSSTITKKLRETDREACKLKVQIAWNSPKGFIQSRYCPK